MLSKSAVAATFDALDQRVFSLREINRIIAEHLDSWQATSDVSSTAEKSPEQPEAAEVGSPNVTDALETLIRETQLERVEFPFPHRAVHRFTWGDVPLLDLLQSLDHRAYFTHFTALRLHGLTDQIPKTVYLNVEQKAYGGGGTLTQDAIDRAFRGKPRTSHNVVQFRGLRVVKLNGKNTRELGVIRISPDGTMEPVRITNVERTLIDATVRPVYCGGVAEVAKAFSVASDRVSINRLCAYLRKLDYTYPYHQAIGFYMERSGRYEKSQLNLLRQFPIEFDFYLTYEMNDPDFHPGWRLFFPKGF